MRDYMYVVRMLPNIIHTYVFIVAVNLVYTEYTMYACISRLMVVSFETKEEVPYDGLSTNAREYFTRTNLVKIKNAITDEPKTLGLYYSS